MPQDPRRTSIIGGFLDTTWRNIRQTDRVEALEAELKTLRDEASVSTRPPNVTAQEIERVFLELLGRPPENPDQIPDASALDFSLGVAQSDERKNLVADEVTRARQQDYHLSKTDLGYIVTHAKDMVVGQTLRFHGTFEEDDIRIAIETCDRLDAPVTKNVFLDIGANIGTHSLRALQEGFERVVAFEPDEVNFRLLRVNQVLNGADSRILNIQAAVSDGNVTGVLEKSPENFGDHRVRATASEDVADLYDEDSRDTSTIRLATLDTLLSEAGVAVGDIGLVWIDTQGHEGQVLQGAHCLKSSKAPIAVEFWPYGLARANGYPLLRAFLSEGQRIFDLRAMRETGGEAPLDLDALDALHDRMLREDTGDGPVYTDILILPAAS